MARAKRSAAEARRPLALAPPATEGGSRRHVAVVDIGSNSVRLVVYDSLSRAPLPRFNEKSLCGLGAGLERTGRLPDEAVARTLTALHRYVAIARAMEVERLDLIATEAVRRAENGPALIDAIRAETGHEPRILTGAEEAHFAALGVISGFYRPRGLIGDMGGGSLEVAEVADDRVGERSVSLPLGALPVEALLAEHGSGARQRVDAILGDRLPPLLTEPVFYPVGGGWRALARVHMAKTNAPVQVTHGYELDGKTARAFAKSVWRMSGSEIAALPDVPTRRVRTLAAAALVLERVLRKLKPERVIFSALGLREGWLYAQLSEAERYLDPLVEGARAIGQPRARVPAFGAALVRWTDALFPGESHAEMRLRVAACALSDIAWSDHRSVQAGHAFQSLLRFPFIGIEHRERAFVAAAVHARYGGAPDDPVLRPAIDLLPASLQRRAQILGRALLVGYRFSGSVPEILDSARLRIEADRVRLEVSSTESVPDSEAVRARMKQLARTLGMRHSEIEKVGEARRG
jgi:exopolyphosphatase/guanosine-5'-triphosphate,3'-diphosphate pyrophosphatase